MRERFDELFRILYGIADSEFSDPQHFLDEASALPNPLRSWTEFVLSNQAMAKDYPAFAEPMVSFVGNIALDAHQWSENEPGISTACRTLLPVIDEANGRIGVTWSHNAKIMSRLVEIIVVHSNDEDLIADSLQRLWRLAFEHDQWDAQPTAIRLFKQPNLTDPVVLRIAAYISDSGIGKQDNLKDLPQKADIRIRRAIRIAMNGRQ